MKRYCPNSQGEKHIHDLVVVGGGIYGASMAYTASLSDIDVVLLEQDDFAQHTSANSQKVIHGGIRYLQSFDIKRVIESIKEKHRFYRLFPHQVQPLPCLLPTSGFFTHGNEAFRIAFLLYRTLEKFLCKKKIEQKPHVIPRNGVCQHFPHLQKEKIRGGALWYDGLCVEPERVIISLLKSTAKHGGHVANYSKVVAFHKEKEGYFQITVHDRIDDSVSHIYSKKIALCTGPWFQETFQHERVEELPKELTSLSLIRGINVIVPSLFDSAISLAAKIKDGIESRFLFIVPWKKYSLEGTSWEDADFYAEERENYKEEVEAFHKLHQQTIKKEDDAVPILSNHLGYVPGHKNDGTQASGRILSHYKFINRDGSNNEVLQIIGVKFTTAFDVVYKALHKLFPDKNIQNTFDIESKNLPCGSFDGSAENVLQKNKQQYGKNVTDEQFHTLFQLFGIEVSNIIKDYIQPQKEFYRAITRYCIEHEMIYHLSDIIWRRLFPDYPKAVSEEIVETITEEMASEYDWTDAEKKEEIIQMQKRRMFP